MKRSTGRPCPVAVPSTGGVLDGAEKTDSDSQQTDGHKGLQERVGADDVPHLTHDVDHAVKLTNNDVHSFTSLSSIAEAGLEPAYTDGAIRCTAFVLPRYICT